MPKKFAVDVKERQDRLPTLYWLHPSFIKDRIKLGPLQILALVQLQNFRLTAIKAKVIKYCETVYERSAKNMFWPIKIMVKYLVN